MSRPRARRGGVAGRLAGVLLVLVTVAGCGASPDEVGPRGVDGLVVPTPDPDPADFVARVDNPWLPLAPGTRWTREVTGPEGRSTRVVEVLEETREVAGVETTQVLTRTRPASGPAEEALELFAQDRAGNVWAFGEEGVWQAGVDGAEAGLAMAADPRRGDGHVRWSRDGEPQALVRVGEVGTAATVEAGRFTDLLGTVLVPPSGEEVEVYRARGVGEVLRLAGGERVELVAHRPPG